MKKSAKGKLLDCFNNRRREYKKAGIIAARRSPSVGHISESISLLSQTETDTAGNVMSFNILMVIYYLNHIITFVHFQITGNENVDDEIKWLNNSSDPWNLVENYWTITRKERFKNVFNSNSKELLHSQYMKNFPALKKPNGFNLVSIIKL